MLTSVLALIKRPAEPFGLATGFVPPRSEADNEQIRQESAREREFKVDDQSARDEGGVEKTGE
jgi:hypothetical protein